MTQISRRSVLATTGLGMLLEGVLKGWGRESAKGAQTAKTQDEGDTKSLPLTKYPNPKPGSAGENFCLQPVSMVRLKETHVPRAKYPVIDFHTHLTDAAKSLRGSIRSRRPTSGQWCLCGSGTGHRCSTERAVAGDGAQKYSRSR
jgi:hypothetical protein